MFTPPTAPLNKLGSNRLSCQRVLGWEFWASLSFHTYWRWGRVLAQLHRPNDVLIFPGGCGLSFVPMCSKPHKVEFQQPFQNTSQTCLMFLQLPKLRKYHNCWTMKACCSRAWLAWNTYLVKIDPPVAELGGGLSFSISEPFHFGAGSDVVIELPFCTVYKWQTIQCLAKQPGFLTLLLNSKSPGTWFCWLTTATDLKVVPKTTLYLCQSLLALKIDAVKLKF